MPEAELTVQTDSCAIPLPSKADWPQVPMSSGPTPLRVLEGEVIDFLRQSRPPR